MVLLLYVWLIENFNMFIILLFSFSNSCHNFEVWISRMQKCLCLYRSNLFTHEVCYIVSDWYLRGLCCSSIWLEIFKLFNNPIRVLTQNQNTELWFVFLLKLSKWSLDICLKREKKNGVHFIVVERWRKGIDNQYYTLTPFCSKR